MAKTLSLNASMRAGDGSSSDLGMVSAITFTELVMVRSYSATPPENVEPGCVDRDRRWIRQSISFPLHHAMAFG
jgi:hypothetical protein